MNAAADSQIPAGRTACWECTGTGQASNSYAHQCDSPLCQDPPVLECPTCDGVGYTDLDD